MKKTLILSALSLLILAGCGNTVTTNVNTGSTAETGAMMDNTDIGSTAQNGMAIDNTGVVEVNTGKTTPTEFRFGINTCDQYTKLMECVISKIPTSAKADTVVQYENVIKMWKGFSGDDLKAICDQTMTALNDTKESFEKIGCKL